MSHNILLVEDDPFLLKTLEKIFVLEGFFVTCASSNAEALGYIEKTCFDVIISDIFRPGGNGIEFTREVKKEHPEIKIIILSGNADRLYSKAYEAGADDVLSKPNTVKGILNTVWRALDMPLKDPPDLNRDMRKLPPISLRLFYKIKGRAKQEGLIIQEFISQALEEYLE